MCLVANSRSELQTCRIVFQTYLNNKLDILLDCYHFILNSTKYFFASLINSLGPQECICAKISILLKQLLLQVLIVALNHASTLITPFF